jgi:prepilin-type processing-associated H-X9-DG protein
MILLTNAKAKIFWCTHGNKANYLYSDNNPGDSFQLSRKLTLQPAL